MESNAVVLIAVLVTVALCLLLAALQHRRRVRCKAGGLVGSRGALYRELVARVGGDKACADRLVQLEREKAPGSSDAELTRRAIQRLERDRGR